TEQNRLRESAERQAGEIGNCRNELEAQLKQLRQELGTSQKQQLSQQQNSSEEQTRLETRIKELYGAKIEAELEVKRLTEALANETRRRESAESRADQTGQHRGDLESELAKYKQAQALLRQELEASQK